VPGWCLWAGARRFEVSPGTCYSTRRVPRKFRAESRAGAPGTQPAEQEKEPTGLRIALGDVRSWDAHRPVQVGKDQVF